MKRVKVYGKTEVMVYQIVEVEDDATIDDIIDKASEEFEGVQSYAGNGGRDKLVGVYGEDTGIECNDDVEFAPNGESDIEEE